MQSYSSSSCWGRQLLLCAREKTSKFLYEPHLDLTSTSADLFHLFICNTQACWGKLQFWSTHSQSVSPSVEPYSSCNPVAQQHTRGEILRGISGSIWDFALYTWTATLWVLLLVCVPDSANIHESGTAQSGCSSIAWQQDSYITYEYKGWEKRPLSKGPEKEIPRTRLGNKTY